LYENGTQEFLGKVMEELPESEPKDESHKEDATESDALLSNADTSNASNGQSLKEEEAKAFASVRHILRGTKSIELNLEFLYRNNHTDKAVLNKIRDSLEARNSIFHSSVTFANAFMNAGTTNDTFFRENLDWLGKAVNWSKFSATAALGVIHRGNITQGQKLLEPYLPKDSVSTGSHYEQGGSLYALGMIYANHGSNVLDYLLKQFQNASEEVIQHGGALGVGVAGMATGSEEIFDASRASCTPTLLSTVRPLVSPWVWLCWALEASRLWKT
jgi:26S proteasome regulatory subunit N2